MTRLQHPACRGPLGRSPLPTSGARGLRISLGAVLLALMLARALLLPRGAAARAKTSSEYVEQGLHYLSKGRPGLALKELTAGLDAPGAQEDFDLHINLARLYYENLLMEKAFPEVILALRLGMPGPQKDEARNFLKEMKELYGGVSLRPPEGMREDIGPIRLEADSEMIRVHKKKVFAKLQARLGKARMKIPSTLYLPFGSYLINGIPFDVRRGDVTELVLRLSPEEPPPPPLSREEDSDFDLAILWYVGGAAAAAVVAAGAVVILSSPPPEPERRLEVEGKAF